MSDPVGAADEGWERRCVAGEPRLSEIRALYEELGLEVLCVPVLEACQPGSTGDCTECFSGDPDPARFKVVFTRTARRTGEEGEGS